MRGLRPWMGAQTTHSRLWMARTDSRLRGNDVGGVREGRQVDFRCGGDLSQRSRGNGNVGVGVGVSSMLSKRADVLELSRS